MFLRFSSKTDEDRLKSSVDNLVHVAELYEKVDKLFPYLQPFCRKTLENGRIELFVSEFHAFPIFLRKGVDRSKPQSCRTILFISQRLIKKSLEKKLF